MIGGAHSLDYLVTGAVISIRSEEDVLAVWTDHRDRQATLRIREVLIKNLNLPPNTMIEFKRHSSVPVVAKGTSYYTIAELLRYQDHCPDPPLYIWDSLEALAELSSKGGKDGKDGELPDNHPPMSRDSYNQRGDSYQSAGQKRPDREKRDRGGDRDHRDQMATGDPLLDAPGGRRGQSLWD